MDLLLFWKRGSRLRELRSNFLCLHLSTGGLTIMQYYGPLSEGQFTRGYQVPNPDSNLEHNPQVKKKVVCPSRSESKKPSCVNATSLDSNPDQNAHTIKLNRMYPIEA